VLYLWIMNKFQKRVSKISRKHTNALVIGKAFGYLSEILGVYGSVFVIDEISNGLKAKNLIYRESIDRLISVSDIGAIFLDLNDLDKLESLMTVWQKHNSVVFIEGDSVISREFSLPLYQSGWRCTSLQGIFHVWEQQK
jgi:hypothetical protein